MAYVLKLIHNNIGYQAYRYNQVCSLNTHTCSGNGCQSGCLPSGCTIVFSVDQEPTLIHVEVYDPGVELTHSWSSYQPDLNTNQLSRIIVFSCHNQSSKLSRVWINWISPCITNKGSGSIHNLLIVLILPRNSLCITTHS